MPNASDIQEDDKSTKIQLTGLEGSTRLFLGSEGGYILYLQPGGRGPTVVRGSVSKQGRRVAGSGFTVSPPATGTNTFAITFDTAFPERPIVVATISGRYKPRANAHVSEVTATHAVISTGADDGRAAPETSTSSPRPPPTLNRVCQAARVRGGAGW
ncbi:hypothetical protein [Actinoallomurus sp. NPDC050550]|uniref:hypothetical protein n=1 Tax=Actinoallomurus sp. NPDC050550 TaxID=3154937 RepID=UPI0033FE5320